MSTSVYKEKANTKTEFTFRYTDCTLHSGGAAVYLGNPKPNSVAAVTGLVSGMRVWAIDETTRFASNTAAVGTMFRAVGWITLVVEFPAPNSCADTVEQHAPVWSNWKEPRKQFLW